MSATSVPEPAPIKTEIEAAWTRGDVARYLRVSQATVMLWLEQGRLPKPRKIGRRLLWDPRAVRALVETEG